MSKTFPRKFGRYELHSLLGAGGMGEVFRAETIPIAGIKRTLAIKHITVGDANLVEEARIWVRLQHPNIVAVHDFGEQDGDWFLALELVEGISAAQLIAYDEPLSGPEALCIVERVAKALAYAHSLTDGSRPLNILHRDVKPANILLSLRGEVKLTDFGIARASDTVERTQAGMVKGSVPYLSPEQVRSEPLDARSDLFSLGCTLHKLVTGRPLIDLPPDAALRLLSNGDIPPPPPHLGPALRELLGSLTAADRRRRPASAADVARQARAMLLPESVEDVEAVLAGRVVRIATLAGLHHDPTADRSSASASVTAWTPEPATRAPGAPPPPSAETLSAPVPPAVAETVSVNLHAATTAPAPARADDERAAERRRKLIAGVQSPLFTAVAVLAVVGVTALLGARWFLCKSATNAREDARGGFISLRAARNAEISRCRFCGANELDRASRALASGRAGDPLDVSTRGLGDSPVERRALATLELADAGWSVAAVTSARRDLQTPAGACLSAIAAFDRGGHPLPIYPVEASNEPCGLALRGSSRLAAGDLAGADEAFGRLTSHRAGPAGRMMVASLRGSILDLESAAVASERLRDRPDEELAGIWIPSSWSPLPGEAGRVTSALDDLPTIAALARGDLAARERKMDAARNEYEKPLARGWKRAEIAARIADAEIGRGNPDAAAYALLEARKHEPASPLLLAREVRVRIARKQWVDAESALVAVKHPDTLRALRAELATEKARPPGTRPYGADDPPPPAGRASAPTLAAGPRPAETPFAGSVSSRPVAADPNAPKLRRSVDVAKTLAEAKKRVEAGRAGQAISLLEEAARSEPDEPTLAFELWKLHSRGGDIAAARRWAVRYLELDAKSQRAATVRAWQSNAK